MQIKIRFETFDGAVHDTAENAYTYLKGLYTEIQSAVNACGLSWTSAERLSAIVVDIQTVKTYLEKV